MTSYLGFDVLEISPNARDPREDAFLRSVATFDPVLGRSVTRSRDAAPQGRRPLLWTCANRAEIVAFQAFLAARKGRLVPFWMPSRRQDLLLNQSVAAADPGIVIRATGYTRFMFPVPGRRHLAFLAGGSWVIRSVDSSAEGGASESLQLSSPLGVSLPSSALVCHLLYCRLAADEVELIYHTDSIAEAQIDYLEIPREAP